MEDIVVALCPAIFQRTDPTPKNNSDHDAKARLSEIINHEHAEVFRTAARMNKPTFIALCVRMREITEMQDKRDTTVEEITE